MNLKESFRYQSFLDSAISTISSYLRNRSNVVDVTESHLKFKYDKDAEDEVISSTNKDSKQLGNYETDLLIDVVACAHP